MKSVARYLSKLIREDALASRKMAIVSGPRQVGKTTLARSLLANSSNYFNWDQTTFRRSWAKDPLEALGQISAGPVVIDELHKYRHWKRSLKGVYDEIGDAIPLLITGSARLDLYRKGGESLLGRYLPYRLHPFSVAERPNPASPDQLQVGKIQFALNDIEHLSAFPEPLLGGSQAKAKRWSRLRMERIIQEDVRDIRAINQLSQLQLLVDLLPPRVGAPLSLNSLREDLDVAYDTVRQWVQTLSSLYVIFAIVPHSRNIRRSLKAEKKIYLFDTLPIEDSGFRLENIMALHLLKACDYWTESAQGHFELKYLRTKEKEEVDFCILRDKKVWMLVESKGGQIELAPSLIKFTTMLKPEYSFQTVNKRGYDRTDAKTGIRVLSAERFLSMLV